MKIEGYDIKIRIHPRFRDIADYVQRVHAVFPSLTYIIQNKRNDIRLDNIDGHRLVIKSFKGMYLPNRLAYSLFRKSKAQRSFETSLRLQSLSFHTPMPVAYIDYYKLGILQASYFISLHQNHKDLQNALSCHSLSHGLAKLFAGFAFQLHQAGVCHDDFSKGNILCVVDGNRIYFSLIDLNRVKFRRVHYRAGLRSLSKLGIRQDDFEDVLRMYTRLWGRSFSDARQFIQRVRDQRTNTRKVKRFFKRIFFSGRLAVLDRNEVNTPRSV
ncbi:lipopolysaccharide kinase InaA family protein [Parachryseolinea silvisoli]|jgi:tRNA A-37 threonylcarbamoyl transferase component Bud32|uniref:lipopolysaccharide kinase InaA family protein n=1 Tax=Parachryseolinea silvisoli TaxID=2873601 RepID=UPI00226582AE|nr:lipopolysaccharide kinase InaA family protein [Parachryseolinea silvisoli]MCD9015725.1 lipopolysaccharide kinase InaA family protein [Parachryseolinea silvisoli]